MKSFHNLLGLTSILLMLYFKESLQRPPTNATITKQPTTKQATSKLPTSKLPTSKQPTSKLPTSKLPTTKQPTTTSAIITTNVTTDDDLENYISPEDLEAIIRFHQTKNSTDKGLPVSILKESSCFSLGSFTSWILSPFFNLKPDDAQKVNAHFYFYSKVKSSRVEVYPGKQFNLEKVDYNPKRKTVMIVHGFMSHSKVSWVRDMARAFLEWEDVNVIAVDWSGGGNTWKYWNAVVNVNTVGADIKTFTEQLMKKTGAKLKDFHFVGHSLGAHISAFASNHLGGVGRITGLDPAQPCFKNSSKVERLDKEDADFVDIIHTNGRQQRKMGFGLPNAIGHVDFYPNGGMKQPGCFEGTPYTISKILPAPLSTAKIRAAVCSHARAYLLFTQSLINKNCDFQAFSWDLSFEGLNASLKSNCKNKGSCAEMGINANSLRTPKAQGSYFLITKDKEPYCVPPQERRLLPKELYEDLSKNLIRTHTSTDAVLRARHRPTKNLTSL